MARFDNRPVTTNNILITIEELLTRVNAQINGHIRDISSS